MPHRVDGLLRLSGLVGSTISTCVHAPADMFEFGLAESSIDLFGLLGVLGVFTRTDMILFGELVSCFAVLQPLATLLRCLRLLVLLESLALLVVLDDFTPVSRSIGGGKICKGLWA